MIKLNIIQNMTDLSKSMEHCFDDIVSSTYLTEAEYYDDRIYDEFTEKIGHITSEMTDPRKLYVIWRTLFLKIGYVPLNMFKYIVNQFKILCATCESIIELDQKEYYPLFSEVAYYLEPIINDNLYFFDSFVYMYNNLNIFAQHNDHKYFYWYGRINLPNKRVTVIKRILSIFGDDKLKAIYHLIDNNHKIYLTDVTSTYCCSEDRKNKYEVLINKLTSLIKYC